MPGETCKLVFALSLRFLDISLSFTVRSRNKGTTNAYRAPTVQNKRVSLAAEKFGVSVWDAVPFHTPLLLINDKSVNTICSSRFAATLCLTLPAV